MFMPPSWAISSEILFTKQMCAKFWALRPEQALAAGQVRLPRLPHVPPRDVPAQIGLPVAKGVPGLAVLVGLVDIQQEEILVLLIIMQVQEVQV